MGEGIELPPVEGEEGVSDAQAESINLDRITIEPKADVELKQDPELADAIQTALVEAVQPVMTEEASDQPSPAVPDSPIPPPDSGEADSDVPAPRPDSPNDHEGDNVPSFNSKTQAVMDNIEGQSESVKGAVDGLKAANEIVSELMELADEMQVESPKQAAGEDSAALKEQHEQSGAKKGELEEEPPSKSAAEEEARKSTSEADAHKPSAEAEARETSPPMEDLSIVAGAENSGSPTDETGSGISDAGDEAGPTTERPDSGLPPSDPISDVNDIQGQGSPEVQRPQQDGELQIFEDEIEFTGNGEIPSVEVTGREIPDATEELSDADSDGKREVGIPLAEAEARETSPPMEDLSIVAGLEIPEIDPSDAKPSVVSDENDTDSTGGRRVSSRGDRLEQARIQESKQDAAKVDARKEAESSTQKGTEDSTQKKSESSSQMEAESSSMKGSAPAANGHPESPFGELGQESPADEASDTGSSDSDLENWKENEPEKPVQGRMSDEEYAAALENFIEEYKKWIAAKPPDEGTEEDKSADNVMSEGQLAAPYIPGGSVLSAAMSELGQLKNSIGG